MLTNKSNKGGNIMSAHLTAAQNGSALGLLGTGLLLWPFFDFDFFLFIKLLRESCTDK